MNRGINTAEYWSNKHLAEYDLSSKECTENSYWKITKDILLDNNNFFKNKTLLDVGCAAGKSLYYFNKYLPDWKYTGYDFSESGINSAKINYKNYPNIELIQKDFILNPVDKDFDVITIFETIEHIEEGANYTVLDNLLEHCQWLFLSTVTTKDDCRGEHISWYDIDTFEKKGYSVKFKMYLDEIYMPDGIYHYFINILEGKL